MFFTKQINSYLCSNKIFQINIFLFNIEKIRAGNWQQVHIWKNNVNMTFNSFKQMVRKQNFMKILEFMPEKNHPVYR